MQTAGKPCSSLVGKRWQQLAGAIFLASALAGTAVARETPGAINAMLANGKGVKVVENFDVPGANMTAWVLEAGGERRIYYVPNGSDYALLGIMFDASLNNLSAAHAQKYLKPASASTPQLEYAPAGKSGFKPASTAAPLLGALSRATPSHVEGSGPDVFIIYDPVCPYCHTLWRNTRSLLGSVRLNWIPIAKISHRSAALAESIVASADPAAAFSRLVEGNLPPANEVRQATSKMLQDNYAALAGSGEQSVPLIAFGKKGAERAFVGSPNADQLKTIVELSK